MVAVALLVEELLDAAECGRLVCDPVDEDHGPVTGGFDNLLYLNFVSIFVRNFLIKFENFMFLYLILHDIFIYLQITYH